MEKWGIGTNQTCRLNQSCDPLHSSRQRYDESEARLPEIISITSPRHQDCEARHYDMSLKLGQVLTSRVTLNFRARSLTLSSNVRPVIIPFILESAKGDRFPD